jgi:hypothetical protein
MNTKEKIDIKELQKKWDLLRGKLKGIKNDVS